MKLTEKLQALKQHAQYMQNMLELGQTLMSIDHATLTDLFNECQPAQKNSLDHADARIAELEKEVAKLRAALEDLAAIARS